jgi:hypothetical protein
MLELELLLEFMYIYGERVDIIQVIIQVEQVDIHLDIFNV